MNSFQAPKHQKKSHFHFFEGEIFQIEDKVSIWVAVEKCAEFDQNKFVVV